MSAPDPSFWNGTAVLVTGHTGFKGAWLTLWLARLGARVTGLSDRVPTSPSLYDAAGVADDLVADHRVDVRDLDAVRAAMAAAEPEVVLHLAAQPIVRAGYADPVGTYAVNVMGTVNVLEAVRQTAGVAAAVNVTSDKCYENREWVWPYREDEPLGGADPYSSSKACSELVTAAYRRSFLSEPGGPVLASARAGNVIGGGDWAADRLLPDLARAEAAGEDLVLRNPGATRPWQHVLNPLSGYLRLAERLAGDRALAEGWNFGPPDGDARTVGEVLEAARALWGGGAAVRSASGAQPHEAGYLALDSSKARARLGWRPGWDLDRGLAETVSWYRAAQAGEDARALSLAQIAAYEDGASAASSAA